MEEVKRFMTRDKYLYEKKEDAIAHEADRIALKKIKKMCFKIGNT